MSSTLVIILFSAGAVGLFMLGMSLTLIFKGHNMRSEIGDNPHMKARGIKCAVSEAHEQESTSKQRRGRSKAGWNAAGDDGCASERSLCGDNSCHSCESTTTGSQKN